MINSYYGSHRNRKFSDIFPNVETFSQTYKECPIFNQLFNHTIKYKAGNTEYEKDLLNELYYYMYSKYGNSTIASSDETQFKFKLWMIISTNGIIWYKKQESLCRLISLTDEEIKKNQKSWTNLAQDPGNISDGKISSDTFLDYIQAQNVSQSEAAPVVAYSTYMAMLSDNTETFLQSFKKLFITVVDYEAPLLYESEDYGYGN